jgi:hypothetical protein
VKLTILPGGRDGRLVVASRDVQWFADARAVAPTMQAALDDCKHIEPRFAVFADHLEQHATPHGALSGWAIKYGATPPKARILVLTLLAMIAPLGALNALAPPVVVSLALGSMVAFCHTAWVINQSALLVDLYPGPQLAKAFATSGLLAGAVTIGSQYLIGQLVASLTYRPMFLVIAVAYPFGLLAAWLATRAMRRRAWETRPDAQGGR